MLFTTLVEIDSLKIAHNSPGRLKAYSNENPESLSILDLGVGKTLLINDMHQNLSVWKLLSSEVEIRLSSVILHFFLPTLTNCSKNGMKYDIVKKTKNASLANFC